MPTPQIIRSPNGDEMVVIPRAEYDALVAAWEEAEEDAADVAAYDAAKATLAADPSAILPEPVSAGVLRGDSVLKALRKWRGLTQVELAEKTGLAQGYVSDLESRRKPGSAEAAAKLAAALDVPVSWLESSRPDR